MIDIGKLLQQLDDVTAWGAEGVSRQHLLSLARQSAAAIRELQAAKADERHKLVLLAQGLSTLGAELQRHA